MLGKIKGRKRRGQHKMNWMIAVIDSMDGHEFEQALGNSEGQGSLACFSLWGHKELDMT